MTSRKKPDSAILRKKRRANRPPNLLAAADSVIERNVNMSMGSTLAASYFLPRMAVGGANTA